MPRHMVKCKICNEQFDANVEPFVIDGRRYMHLMCSEKQNAKKSQDEVEYEELEKYIKKLFGKTYITARIKKQIRDFRREYNYTYSGMQKCLIWWFDVKKNSLDKANDGIGIIPFIYDDAKKYYYSLYLAQLASESIDVNKLSNVKEIEIESPRVYVPAPKLFNLDEMED